MRLPPFLEQDFSFPLFYRVKRRFKRPRIDDLSAAVQQAVATALAASPIRPGDSVAVGVGSRGIAQLPVIVGATCQALKTYGARPIVFPAMGSHGGATAEGQLALLKTLGVDESTCGCPVVSSLKTRNLGEVFGEVPVYFAATALNADHCIGINRIKPHTKFKGDIESGLLKLLTVGMGKHNGAMAYHRYALKYGFLKLLRAIGQTILDRSNFRFGLGIVENAYDEPMHVGVLPKDSLPEQETRLLEVAKANLARLPIDSLDLLVVGRIGKEIAGTGMDTNVVGRAYDLMEDDFSQVLKATRVAILDLSEATKGNAAGMGNADIITERVFQKLDYEKTLMNCLTGMSLRKVFIPVRMPNDYKAVQTGFATIGPVEPDRVRAVIIRDTLHLTDFWISEGLKTDLEHRDDVDILEQMELPFDTAGNLTGLPEAE